MEIKILGCYGGREGHYRLTSFLVNNTLAIDAGSITDALSFDEQQQITDVIISHTHLDHTNSLPFLVDNIFGETHLPLRIHSHAEVLRQLQTHVFNDVSWPDFSKLPSPEKPSVEYREMKPGETFRIGELEIKPIWVNHLVPTTGMVVTEEGKSWIYSSDTWDTDEIWEIVNNLGDPRLLFIECSYPNRFEELAKASKHLTPADVGRQLAKLDREIPVRVYHFKPSYLEEIKSELEELNHPDLELLEQDRTYSI